MQNKGREMELWELTYETSSEPICSESFDAHQDLLCSSSHHHRIHRHHCNRPLEKIVGHSCQQPCPCQSVTWLVMLISTK